MNTMQLLMMMTGSKDGSLVHSACICSLLIAGVEQLA